MTLTEADETKIYKVKVGLPVYKFDSAGLTKFWILPGSAVIYDQLNNGSHIFHVIDVEKKLDGGHYVRVPEGYEDDWLEGPLTDRLDKELNENRNSNG
jgi:hypothetical protein